MSNKQKEKEKGKTTRKSEDFIMDENTEGFIIFTHKYEIYQLHHNIFQKCFKLKI